jgi:DNA processing protein
VVDVVRSYFPFLALLVSEGLSRADCFALPRDPERAFAMLQTPDGRHELSRAIGKRIGEIAWERFEAQVRAIERSGVAVLCFNDPEFPDCFRTIHAPPALIFYRGSIEPLRNRGIAIVGTRKPSARGALFARKLARDLSERNVMVASGCARGIDAAAHEGSLEGTGPCVAVLGTGLDVPYPAENIDLMHRIAERGCLVSEQLMGVPPSRFAFPQRNRLISAVSHAVIVVEAGEKSGARITARWALEQGRDVGAVPGFPGDFRSRGVNALLREGAFLVESAADVFEAVPLLGFAARLPLSGRGAIENPPAGASVNGGIQEPHAGAGVRDPYGEGDPGLLPSLLQELSGAPIDPDALAVRLGVTSARVHALLSALEIEGKIAVDHSGCYYTL